ncbi:MAG: TIM44-like domain-containing protein [Gammaproteobacteria bacterium]|nr:TIM44-like domain-containing protein [Gammaproteobacteria bacterium]
MQRFLSITLALFIGLTFSFDAEARRFGGGKSFGSAPKHQQAKPQQRQQQQQPAAQQGQNAGKPAAATSGAAKWLGPLAAIAAGGLLASMLFGDGFEGLQIMDILIFAGIAFLLFKLLASRRKPQMQPMPAGAPMQRDMPAGNNPFGGFGSSAPAASAAPVMQAPAWFNADSFLTAAREHFNQLQMHWDANEMDKISEFVTPDMLGFLQRERAELGDGYQSTYIDNLDVQLDGVEELDDYTVATLSFTGVSKTSRFDQQGEAFSESWRMERKHGDNQPWLIAGIRQNA